MPRRFLAGLLASAWLGAAAWAQPPAAAGKPARPSASPGAARRFYAAAGKADITPDLSKHRIYLAGYGAKGRRASGINDPLHARGLLVSDGATTLALVAVDAIGLFREDVLWIRRKLGWTDSKRYLLVAATHSHSAPDTAGLWGPAPGLSGVDRRYHRRLRRKVVDLVRELEGRLVEAELVAARTELDPTGFCRDIRDPVVLDPELNVLQFRRPGGAPIGTLVRWSCHPEVLREGNTMVSADFPGALCGAVEAKTGAPCAYFSGAIGGLLIPDTEANVPVERQFEQMEALGERLAQRALGALKGSAERVTSAEVRFSTRVVLVPVENSRYLLFLRSLAFGHRLLDREGRPLPAWKSYWLPAKHLARFPLPAGERPWVETEAARLSLGPVEILGIPGELFPELALGGYDGRYRFGHPVVRPTNPSPPRLAQAPRGPYLRERLNARHGLLIGLANDEIGYILPDYDFAVNPNRSMVPHPPGDHYEETNSIGRAATGILLQAYEELLAR